MPSSASLLDPVAAPLAYAAPPGRGRPALVASGWSEAPGAVARGTAVRTEREGSLAGVGRFRPAALQGGALQGGAGLARGIQPSTTTGQAPGAGVPDGSALPGRTEGVVWRPTRMPRSALGFLLLVVSRRLVCC